MKQMCVPRMIRCPAMILHDMCNGFASLLNAVLFRFALHQLLGISARLSVQPCLEYQLRYAFMFRGWINRWNKCAHLIFAELHERCVSRCGGERSFNSTALEKCSSMSGMDILWCKEPVSIVHSLDEFLQT